jgi:hypothetical protein
MHVEQPLPNKTEITYPDEIIIESIKKLNQWLIQRSIKHQVNKIETQLPTGIQV